MNWRFRNGQWMGDDGEYRLVVRRIVAHPKSTTQFDPYYIIQYDYQGRSQTVSVFDQDVEQIKTRIYEYLLEDLL